MTVSPMSCRRRRPRGSRRCSNKAPGCAFIGDGINDAIALRQADVSISLSGATTVATDAAQIVLMDNDLRQMRLLWALASGFELSLNENARLARRFSLGAAGWVLLFPFKFLAVELFWGAQAPGQDAPW